MGDELIFENITELKTPVGCFTVMDGNEPISFSVMKNGMDCPYEVSDDKNNVIGVIQTDTNYSIVINANTLQVGNSYVVKFVAETESKWEYCDSDEHTTCYDAIIDEWVVGIGAYDPNNQEKERQAWKYSEDMGFLDQKFIQEPAAYDEINFVQYSVDILDTCDGYRIKLYDYSIERINIGVAWVKMEEYSTIEYEGALGLWLC